MFVNRKESISNNYKSGNEIDNYMECGVLQRCNDMNNQFGHVNDNSISDQIKYMACLHKGAEMEIRSKREKATPLNLMINKKIVNSKTLEDMLQIITDYIDSFNEVNMVTIIHRIATKCIDRKKRNMIVRDDRFKTLFESILYVSSHSYIYSPLELANLTWSLVKLGINDNILFDYICNESILLLEQFVPISLSILLCSFAKLVRFYKNLFICSIPKVLLELDNMEPQQISNIAWSYSKVGLISPHLFEKLKNKSIEIIDKFFPIHISILCHAFALTDMAPRNLFELVSKLNIQLFTPKSAVHLVWSFSITGFEIPSEWIVWICNIEVIKTLSIIELTLLATSLCINYIDGFVQIKLNNIIDYNQMINYIDIRMSICKALARRNRDPSNTLIEWNISFNKLELIKVNTNNIKNSFNHNLIWGTIDILSFFISRKLRSNNDVVDIAWILYIIGKDLSQELYQIVEPNYTYTRQKNNNGDGKDCLESALKCHYSHENNSLFDTTSTYLSNDCVSQSEDRDDKYSKEQDSCYYDKMNHAKFQNTDYSNQSEMTNPVNKITNFCISIALLYNIVLIYIVFTV